LLGGAGGAGSSLLHAPPPLRQPPPAAPAGPTGTATPAAATAAVLNRNPMATTGEDQAAPLLDLLERFPDLFATEVLRRVDLADRAFLGQVSSGCRAAVKASDLPCAGTRVGMRQLNPAESARLAGEVRAFVSVLGYVSALAASLGYVASCDVPRAGGVVRLELREFFAPPPGGWLGPRRAGAGGTTGRAHSRLMAGTWRCCGGRGRTGARGT